MSVAQHRQPLLPPAVTHPSMTGAGGVRRALLIAWIDIRAAWRRPIYIIFTAILLLMILGFVLGNVRVQAGDVTAGGKQAWVNSMFNAAFIDSALLGIFLPFFAAITAGMPLIADADRRVDRMVLATALSARAYVAGRWLGTLVPVTVSVAIYVIAQMLMFNLWPIDDPERSRGAFAMWNFIWPALVFGAPLLFAVSGSSMLLGIWTRQAILVFLLPIAILLGGALFLWGWSPEWLPHWANVLLMQLDPAGNRWLAETWLKADRGVDYYNTQPLALDPIFAASRVAWIVFGGACVWFSASIVSRRMRNVTPAAVAAAAARGTVADIREAAQARAQAAQGAVKAVIAQLGAMGMTMRAPSFLEGTMAILRYETRALLRSPGIWLFTPLIILQIVGSNAVNEVWLGTIRLATSGTLAAGSFNTVTLLLVFLTLFYTVESLSREDRHNTAGIIRASSVPTIAMLAGKILANTVIAAIITAGAFVGCLIVIFIQWMYTGILVPIELGVFFMLWGVVLMPTIIFWCAFIALVNGIVRNRYATYAIGLGALVLTGWLQVRGYLNWATNWHMWGVMAWSDLDRLEFLRPSIVGNRLFILYTAALCSLGAIAFHPRRTRDLQRAIDMLRPAKVGKILLKASPLVIAWLVLGGWVWTESRAGFQGAVMERKGRDYWKRNELTFRDAPLVKIDSVDADVAIFPDARRLEVKGTYILSNQHDKPVVQIPLTPGAHFEHLKWTLNDQPIEPKDKKIEAALPFVENRAGLWVFSLEKPLAKGETAKIGFTWDGVFPNGWTKNGGGVGEYVLPSGVVLTSFSPSMMPSIGYVEGVGVDERNATDPKEPEPDAWKLQKDPLFGSGWGSDVTMRVTGPAAWQLNAVGEPIDEKIDGDRKTVTWKTEHPVRFFNICGGPLEKLAGEGVAVWYNKNHQWNVEVMKDTLEKCRHYFSLWFAPFPRKELRLTEFPSLASYAQGFPGNITFSESIGFLSRPGTGDEVDAVFFVTAHETGHQWWGNMLIPGKGLGGNILSEGMANYSAWMLTRECRGEAAAKHVLREWENTYVDRRSADSERPLVKLSGSRPGDSSVTYDKGGWVFVMLMDHMGRDAMLAGLQEFIAKYQNGPDYPLLQQFVAVMRTHAKDQTAFDAFTKQWFEQVVLPEYKVRDAKITGPEGEPPMWTTTAIIDNVGTGTMTIDVAAEGKKPAVSLADAAAAPKDDAKKADAKPAEPPAPRVMTQVTLGPEGTEQSHAWIEIKTPFAPAKLVVDPDVRVLQVRRKLAEWKP
ncbi:MAG: hypothetical protein K8R92_06780 [Planctomycetes bacterium]|nr:hypothetical protein [Planctomycetota bacterium]